MDPTPHFPAEQCLMLNDVARIIASRRNLSDLFTIWPSGCTASSIFPTRRDALRSRTACATG